MPRISRAYSSVFCPREDVSHIWTPDVRKVLRFSNRRVVARFLRSVHFIFLVFLIFHSSSLIGAYARSALQGATNASSFTVDNVSVHVEPQNNVILVVIKSRATPGAIQPELSSDHYVALWLVIIASIISLAFLLIRGLARDLQDTILVLLRFWEKIREEKKRL